MISKEILEKFKRLYEEKFNVKLTDEEATQMATDLVNLVRILTEPDPIEIEENKHLEERRQREIITAKPF